MGKNEKLNEMHNWETGRLIGNEYLNFNSKYSYLCNILQFFTDNENFVALISYIWDTLQNLENKYSPPVRKAIS